MKVVYLASPYRSNCENGVWENIIKAHKMARKLWKAGFVCISPCSNTAFFGGIDDDNIYIKGDLEILKRCDAVLMNKGWEKSCGCIKEKEFAEKHNIPVFESIEALQDFNWEKDIEPIINNSFIYIRDLYKTPCKCGGTYLDANLQSEVITLDTLGGCCKYTQQTIDPDNIQCTKCGKVKSRWKEEIIDIDETPYSC